MAIERTLSIIKPDATRRNLTGAINDRFEKAGLRIVAQKRLQLTRAQAEAFYAVHRERPFFASLVRVHDLGPGGGAGARGRGRGGRNREVMGATDPAKAAAGTIRKDFAEASRRIRCTARTAPRTPATRSRSSSPGPRSSAERRDTVTAAWSGKRRSQWRRSTHFSCPPERVSAARSRRIARGHPCAFWSRTSAGSSREACSRRRCLGLIFEPVVLVKRD